VALEINHRLVYCYVCDRYVANDTRRGELAALRRRLEELCTGIVEESRTRSGLLVRGSTQILALRPQRPDLHRADRRFTALQHWRLSVLARAFNTWRCVAARAELAAGSVSISSRCGVLAASGGGGLRLSFAEAPGQLLTPGQTGLRNLGNTCFMNSVLQALSCLAPFREYFLSVLVPRNSLWRQQTADCFSAAARKRLGEAPLSLSRELHNVLRVMWSGKYAVVTPVALLYTVWQKLPRFRGYQQQDAQEFLCFFRDTIHAELQQPQQPEFSATAAAGEAQPTPAPSPSSMTRRTVVQEMFEGQLESAVECLACGGVSQRSEPFLDLQLDVPSELLHVPRAGSRSRAPPPPRGHLHRLLEASLLCAETIDGYQCERCARPQKARRTLRISHLPRFICLVIKRFTWSTGSAKVDTEIEFPLRDLDFGPYVLPDASLPPPVHAGDEFPSPRSSRPVRATLRSLVIHHGTTLRQGARVCLPLYLSICTIYLPTHPPAYLPTYHPSGLRDDALAMRRGRRNIYVQARARC
jgi:ubiquitin C-terminal hydrolase